METGCKQDEEAGEVKNKKSWELVVKWKMKRS